MRPIGEDDTKNLDIAHGKTPAPVFDFQPLDHVELMEKLGMVDFEAGARVAGHGFYFLKGDAVLLELRCSDMRLECCWTKVSCQ